MHIIVIDTETTGLIPNGIASRDLSKCPHIIQLSYMIFDTVRFAVLEDYDAIIKLSDSIEISERSIEIHKITREKSQMSGVPINVALFNLRSALIKYNVQLIVGHNISFDVRMLDFECRRMGLSGLFRRRDTATTGSAADRCGGGDTASAALWNSAEAIPQYCTMENSKDICNNRVQSMYGGFYVRFSKLSEVFSKLFGDDDYCDTTTAAAGSGESFLHNSRVDVVMCLRIFAWIAYGVDIKAEWMNVMETYIDPNLISLDDAHLLSEEIARDNYVLI
jgi:hypothetical protein